jgi:hypothetical protein
MPRHSLNKTSIDGANKGMDNKMSRTTKANKDRLPDKRRRRKAKKEIEKDLGEQVDTLLFGGKDELR